MNNKIDFFEPKSLILQKYIKGYYFFRENNYSTALDYKVFPSNYVYFTIFHRAEAKAFGNKIITSPTVKNKFSVMVTTHYNRPLEFCYEKEVDELTVIFKPLGLNHFVHDVDLDLNDQFFYEMVFPDLPVKMARIFSCANLEKQKDLIESFWLSKLISPYLKVSSSILKDLAQDLSIQYVAENYGVSRQYLHKIFMKEVGKSPTEFRNIARFRKSLELKKNKMTLTALSLQNGFYDQAHFNKEFKKYSGLTPSTFYKNKSKKEVWLFV